MFERFTDHARRVVVLAQEEARLLDHNYLGTEHLLLGLLHEDQSVAAQALDSLGVTLDQVRLQVEDTRGRGETSPVGRIPFSPRAKKALEFTVHEALQLGHNYVRPEHILLALVREGEGVACQILGKLNVQLRNIRYRVIAILAGTYPPHTPVEPEAEPEPAEPPSLQERFSATALEIVEILADPKLNLLMDLLDLSESEIDKTLAWFYSLKQPDKHPMASVMKVLRAMKDPDLADG